MVVWATQILNRLRSLELPSTGLLTDLISVESYDDTGELDESRFPTLAPVVSEVSLSTSMPDARHPITLRFLDDELEREYGQKLRPRMRRQLRSSLTISLLIWPLAGLATYLVAESWPTILVAAAGWWIGLAVLLVVERRTTTLAGLQLNGAISNTVPGLIALYVLWVEGLFDAAGPITMLATAVFSFTMLGLPFVLSLVAILPYVVACAVLMLVSPTMEAVVLQLAVLALATAVLAAATHMRETAVRRDFYLTRVIADQEKELEEERNKQLGQYTLQSKLGQGGMGVVYRAKHAMLRRPTAVKLLSTKDAGADALARFEKEVQLTSELSHPNIVAVYDYGHSPLGEFYYAMEYLPGLDLESLVADWGPMSLERAVPILTQVCDALAAAHHAGLVHRDIKPGNILVSRVGQRIDVVKVLDFGLVKEAEAPSDLTANNKIAGTPAYLAPEALIAPETVGPASDLYAVGAVAFYLVTGERVFSGATIVEVCGHHVHTEPRPPSLLAGSAVPRAFDEIVLRCLAKDPAERFASATALMEAFAALECRPFRDGQKWWDAFDEARKDQAEPAPSGANALTVDMRRR